MLLQNNNKNPNKYTLFSGGAIGSDSVWDEYAQKYNITERYHYWYKKMNPISLPNHEITYDQYLEGVEMVNQANKFLKRQNIDKYMHLLARNWMQVKNTESIYAISTIKNNIVDGGTSWACLMGIIKNIPVYVFEQNKNKWFYWNGNKYDYCTSPTLTYKFTGIGTRHINDNGKNAIAKVFKNTFL